MSAKSKAVQVRLNVEVADMLSAIALADDRSVSNLIGLIVEGFFDDHKFSIAVQAHARYREQLLSSGE